MLKHEEMIENVHRRIAQYEEEKKMRHSLFRNLFSVIKPNTSKANKNSDDGYTEVESGTERIRTSGRMIRMVSSIAAAVILVTGISATGYLLHKNKPLNENEKDNETTTEVSEITSSNTMVTTSARKPVRIVETDPFSALLCDDYDLKYPRVMLKNSMRESIKEVFDSVKEWEIADNYDRFVHYDNGGSWSPLAERLNFTSVNYSLRICDDNIIEYAVLIGDKWKKTFYECNSLELINSIADIIESGAPYNGVDFDEDVSDFVYWPTYESVSQLSDIQKKMMQLLMKSCEWTEKSAQRDSFVCDFVLNSEKNGRLYIYQGGGAEFVDVSGRVYECAGSDFSEDFSYIMFPYKYGQMETTVRILDKDGKEIITTNAQNSGRLENFILNDFPALIHPIAADEEFRHSNISDYRVEKSYRANGVELRSESYLISGTGLVEREDHVVDPVKGRVPGGSRCYYIDGSIFEAKLNELNDPIPEEKTSENKEEDKKEEGKREEVPLTTEHQEKNTQQATTENAKPTESDVPITTISEYFEDNYDTTKPQVVISHKINKDEWETIASYKTHDNDVLDDFAADIFTPMIMPEIEEPLYGICSIVESYSIVRIYKTNEGKIRRDSFGIFERENFGTPLLPSGKFGTGSSVSYEFDNGEWIPAGAENYSIDFAAFKEALTECLDRCAY